MSAGSTGENMNEQPSSKDKLFDFRVEEATLKWDLPEGVGERPATSAEMYMWAEIERLHALHDAYVAAAAKHAQELERQRDDARIVSDRWAAEAVRLRATGEPRARDADLYEWVSGLVEALNLAGITRAKGDEHIDTDYLAELHSRLSQPPGLRQGLERAIEIVEAIETPSEYYDSYKNRLINALGEAIWPTETKGENHG
jgi:hypothetical protein